MTVNPSFPGIYIQEIPSSSHAIVPAPTSIAAFIGYSHPFKTKAFDEAVRLFSFSDYEANFGGLFSSGIVDASVPRAVYQFFLNGGSDAYVVGLQPGLFQNDGSRVPSHGVLGPGGDTITATLTTTGPGTIVFTALELTDAVTLTVSVTNVRASRSTTPVAKAVFDVVVTYGTRVETFRNVSLDPLDNRIPDAVINGVSTLISVDPGAGYGTAIDTSQPLSFPLTYTPPGAFFTGFSGADFLPVFDANSSLDNVEIFNLLLVPGVTDNAVVSAALAFAERKRAFAIVDPPPQAPAFGHRRLPRRSTTG